MRSDRKSKEIQKSFLFPYKGKKSRKNATHLGKMFDGGFDMLKHRKYEKIDKL